MHRIIFVLSTTGVVYLIEAIETISNPLFFFLQKDFERKKHSRAKTNWQNKNKQTKNNRGDGFRVQENY